MALFAVHYVKDNQSIEKEIAADSRSDVFEQIKGEGGAILSVVEKKPRMGGGKVMEILNSLLNRVKMHDKILIAKNLSAMLDAGLSLSRALGVIEKQTKNKKLKGIISSIGQDLATGKTFHDALGRYPHIFSHLFVAMVKAGEESGSLTDSLRVVGMQMERSHELTKKIRGAMMYPGIIMVAMGGIAFFMLTNVIPSITATFKELDVELPLSTQIVIFVSDFAKNNAIASLLGIVGFFVGLWLFIKTKRGKKYLIGLFFVYP